MAVLRCLLGSYNLSGGRPAELATGQNGPSGGPYAATTRMLISTACVEWVSSPMEIKSTPVSA